MNIDPNLGVVGLLVVLLLLGGLLVIGRRQKPQMALATAGGTGMSDMVAMASAGEETHRSNKAFGRYNNFGQPNGRLAQGGQLVHPPSVAAALYLGALASRGGKRGKLTSTGSSATKKRKYRRPKPKYGNTNQRPIHRGRRKR